MDKSLRAIKTFSVVIFILLFLVVGCRKEDSAAIQSCIDEIKATGISANDFVAGEILVKFNETLTESEAAAILDEYGLEREPMKGALFSAWVTKKGGNMDYAESQRIIEEMTAKDKELYGDKFIVRKISPNYGEMLVMFNTRATENNIKQLFSELDDVEMIKLVYPLNWGKIKVKDGTEFKWICKLKQDPRVKSATLNLLLVGF